MNGLRPASNLPTSADFSRTTCEHLDEHLRALIRRNHGIKIINKLNHLQGINEWRLDLESERISRRGARYFLVVEVQENVYFCSEYDAVVCGWQKSGG
jgi:hypothetical protein